MSPQTAIADQERESQGRELYLPTLDRHVRDILAQAERQYGRQPSFVVAEGTPNETAFVSKYIAVKDTLIDFLCSDSVVGATRQILEEVAPGIARSYASVEVEILRYSIGDAIVRHGFRELKTSSSPFIRHPLEVFHRLYRLGTVDYDGKPQRAPLVLLMGGLGHDFPEEITKTLIRDQMLQDGNYELRKKRHGDKLVPKHWWDIPEPDRGRYEQQSRHCVYTTLCALMDSLDKFLDSPQMSHRVHVSDAERATLHDEIRMVGPIIDLETAPHGMDYFAYGGRLFDTAKLRLQHHLEMGGSTSDMYSFPVEEYTPKVHSNAQMVKFIDRARNTRTMRTTYTGRQPNGDAFDGVRQLFNFYKNIYLLGLAKGCYAARAALLQRDASRLPEFPHYQESLRASLDTLDQFLQEEGQRLPWPAGARKRIYESALDVYEEAGGLNGLTSQGETSEKMGRWWGYFGSHFDGILGSFSVIALDFARAPPRVDVRHQRYKVALAFRRILEKMRDDQWYAPQFTFTEAQVRRIHRSAGDAS